MRNTIIFLLIIFSCYFYASRISADKKIEVITNNSEENFLDIDPIQKQFSSQESQQLTFMHKSFKFIPQAQYDITAMIVSKKNYFLKEEGKLAPIDLALVWGDLIQKDYERFIKYSQSNRWYYFRYKNAPVSKSYIYTHSSNNHIIPANKEILNEIKSMPVNQIVRIKGYLVNIKKENSDWYWNSSLSRQDRGANACEVIYVKEIQTIGQ